MKIKILLLPLSITIAIVILIWFAYPTFTNGYDGVLEKYNQLKSEQAKFNNLDARIKNADSLNSQLSDLGESKNILYEFIPEKSEEEEIIDNLNYIASSSSLSIFKINVELPKSTAPVLPPAAELPTGLNADGSNPAAALTLTPVDKKIAADITMAGTYEAIKVFLDNMYRLGRYNDISLLEIKKIKGEDNQIITNSLMANLEIDFNFMDRAKLSPLNSDDAVFSSDKLDSSIISDITNAKDKKLMKLDIGQKGKANPFNP